MEDNCECNDFEKVNEPSDKILKTLKLIACSEIDSSASNKNGESTAIFKCLKCSSYYILNIHNPAYYNGDFISIKAYTPKTDDNGLMGILTKRTGIISIEDMDLRSIMHNSLKRSNINYDKSKS